MGNYDHRLIKEYEDHVALLEDLALEATRYGNYIASLIRDEVDPSFRFDEGSLLITAAADMLQYQLLRPEFIPSDFNNGEPYIDLLRLLNANDQAETSATKNLTLNPHSVPATSAQCPYCTAPARAGAVRRVPARPPSCLR